MFPCTAYIFQCKCIFFRMVMMKRHHDTLKMRSLLPWLCLCKRKRLKINLRGTLGKNNYLFSVMYAVSRFSIWIFSVRQYSCQEKIKIEVKCWMEVQLFTFCWKVVIGLAYSREYGAVVLYFSKVQHTVVNKATMFG